MSCCYNGAGDSVDYKAWRSWHKPNPSCSKCGDTKLVYIGEDWLKGHQYLPCPICQDKEYTILGDK